MGREGTPHWQIQELLNQIKLVEDNIGREILDSSDGYSPYLADATKDLRKLREMILRLGPQ